MIIKILLLVALIKLLMETNKPFLCSGIYTGIGLLFGLIFGGEFSTILVASIIGFVLSSIYFFLLNRFQANTLLWWIILAVGLLIGLV